MLNSITKSIDIVSDFRNIFGANNDSEIPYIDNQELSASFPNGFKSILDYDISQITDPNDPTKYNEQRILIGHFNRLARLSTLQMYNRQCGNIKTFDDNICNLIGGYPKGIILEGYDGTHYRQIMSLKDNNMISFLSSTKVHGINIIDESKIDNIQWMYCDYENPSFIPWQIDKDSTPFVIVNKNVNIATTTYTDSYTAEDTILVVPALLTLQSNSGSEDGAMSFISIDYTIDGVATNGYLKCNLGPRTNGYVGISWEKGNWDFVSTPKVLNTGDTINWKIIASRKGGNHRIKLVGYKIKKF